MSGEQMMINFANGSIGAIDKAERELTEKLSRTLTELDTLQKSKKQLDEVKQKMLSKKDEEIKEKMSTITSQHESMFNIGKSNGVDKNPLNPLSPKTNGN